LQGFPDSRPVRTGSRKRQHVRIGEGFPFGVPGHGLDIVTSRAQFTGDARGEHLI
jgi:hypothetical protein